VQKIVVLKVLLVTSDFHTRRTLSTFKRLCPQYEFSVAAALDEREFGTAWWERRQWAKVNFDECGYGLSGGNSSIVGAKKVESFVRSRLPTRVIDGLILRG
jgi:hypothetical protein